MSAASTGVILAAPSSGAGKTTVTLALLRLLARQGMAVRGAKSGPDYIDPKFHEAACGAPCPNLDAWAMSPARIAGLASGDGMLVIEGAMGLFDGAPPEGRGAVADLARMLDLPVVLVVDAGRMAGSIAPLVAGFAGFDAGVRIGVANDAAFAFAYPHLLEDWRRAGAEVIPFSPLADEALPPCDFLYLPGGYPELHAGRLARAEAFMRSVKTAAQDVDIYGECGGYMMLGEGLVDAEGHRHAMLGLLGLETSFAQRKLHLGYRSLTPVGGSPFGALPLSGHEFHYATTLRAAGDPLFEARDAEGGALGAAGLRRGRVCGSFAHVIDRAAP